MKPSEIIKKYNINPKKSFWQNFLINEAILENIASFMPLEWKNIVEVWPGYWALTEKILSEKPSSLDLVELDKSMIDILQSRIGNNELNISKETNFKINNIDVLKYNPPLKDYIVIANIPYYITSPILFHFLYEVQNKPTEMIILMQKDVWDKIRKINWNKNSVLSLYIDFKCSLVKEIVKVWPNNFIPAPKVDSSVLYFKVKDKSELPEVSSPEISSKDFLDIIKLWFSEKRKKLISNLSKKYNKSQLFEIFIKLWYSENVRAEELKLEDWIDLLKSLKS